MSEPNIETIHFEIFTTAAQTLVYNFPTRLNHVGQYVRYQRWSPVGLQEDCRPDPVGSRFERKEKLYMKISDIESFPDPSLTAVNQFIQQDGYNDGYKYQGGLD